MECDKCIWRNGNPKQPFHCNYCMLQGNKSGFKEGLPIMDKKSELMFNNDFVFYGFR